MVALLFWEQAEGFESHVFHQKYNEKGAGYIEEVYEWIPGYEGEPTSTSEVKTLRNGPLAQLVEPAAHNCAVAGS